MPTQPPEVHGIDGVLGSERPDGPWIAVSFSDDATDGDLVAAVGAGMDIVEFRVDRFARYDPGHVTAVVGRAAGIPAIATIRSAAEGGAWSGGDDARAELFAHLVGLVDAVDVELSSTTILDGVVGAAHDRGRAVIGSFHDFDGTPTAGELTGVVQRGIDHGVDVVKVATMAHDVDDLGRLARLVGDDPGVGLIVIGMGPAGAPSRLLFPFLGSRVTFAALDVPSAPGQLRLATMADTFRLLSPAYAGRHPAPASPEHA